MHKFVCNISVVCYDLHSIITEIFTTVAFEGAVHVGSDEDIVLLSARVLLVLPLQDSGIHDAVTALS